MKKNQQKGFTLIELIVVTTVIGVLAAIAIPRYNDYKTRSERAVILSDCNALYRGFTVLYIENNFYPFAEVGDAKYLFNPATFAPLDNSTDAMGGMNLGLEMNIKNLLQRVDFEKFDSPDKPLGLNQEYYLVLKWKADPTLKFIVTQSFSTQYADGTPVDGGNWLDGVYMSRGGNIITK